MTQKEIDEENNRLKDNIASAKKHKAAAISKLIMYLSNSRDLCHDLEGILANPINTITGYVFNKELPTKEEVNRLLKEITSNCREIDSCTALLKDAGFPV